VKRSSFPLYLSGFKVSAVKTFGLSSAGVEGDMRGKCNDKRERM
jgi:hypothetical protein